MAEPRESPASMRTSQWTNSGAFMPREYVACGSHSCRTLQPGGVGGVGFLSPPEIESKTTPADVIQRIAQKIQPLGWHVDLYFLPETFEIMAPLIRSLPTPVIIDHMARPAVNVPVEKNEYFQRLWELGASRSDIFWKVTSPDRYTRSARA